MQAIQMANRIVVICLCVLQAVADSSLSGSPLSPTCSWISCMPGTICQMTTPVGCTTDDCPPWPECVEEKWPEPPGKLDEDEETSSEIKEIPVPSTVKPKLNDGATHSLESSKCSTNEELVICNYCERRCENPYMKCKKTFCVGTKCGCKLGFYRDKASGQCVPWRQCLTASGTTRLPMVVPITTRPDTRRAPPANNKIITTTNPTWTVCQPNEMWNTCQFSCEATCTNLNPIFRSPCRPGGCRCRPGFVRNAHGHCVAPKYCPGRARDVPFVTSRSITVAQTTTSRPQSTTRRVNTVYGGTTRNGQAVHPYGFYHTKGVSSPATYVTAPPRWWTTTTPRPRILPDHPSSAKYRYIHESNRNRPYFPPPNHRYQAAPHFDVPSPTPSPQAQPSKTGPTSKPYEHHPPRAPAPRSLPNAYHSSNIPASKSVYRTVYYASTGPYKATYSTGRVRTTKTPLRYHSYPTTSRRPLNEVRRSYPTSTPPNPISSTTGEPYYITGWTIQSTTVTPATNVVTVPYRQPEAHAQFAHQTTVAPAATTVPYEQPVAVAHSGYAIEPSAGPPGAPPEGYRDGNAVTSYQTPNSGVSTSTSSYATATTPRTDSYNSYPTGYPKTNSPPVNNSNNSQNPYTEVEPTRPSYAASTPSYAQSVTQREPLVTEGYVSERTTVSVEPLGY